MKRAKGGGHPPPHQQRNSSSYDSPKKKPNQPSRCRHGRSWWWLLLLGFFFVSTLTLGFVSPVLEDPVDAVSLDPPLKKKKLVFVAGLPKSGTTSLHYYFTCGGYKSSHTYGKKNGTVVRTGRCIEDNIVSGEKPLHDCGDFQVFTDVGYSTKFPKPSHCFYPTLSLPTLKALVDAYSADYDFYLLLNVRSATAWAQSILDWKGLVRRWNICAAQQQTNASRPTDTTLLLPRSEDLEDLAHWYDEANNQVRQFASLQTNLTFVEVTMESPQVGLLLLQETVGISPTCWRHCRPGRRPPCAPLQP